MVLTSDFIFPFVTGTPLCMCFVMHLETTHSKRILSFFYTFKLRQSNFLDCFSSSFLKMEDFQLSMLHILVFFSKTRKSMNMPISASKKEHLFSRIKGCLLIINVAHTKTFSSLLDEIGWFKNTK